MFIIVYTYIIQLYSYKCLLYVLSICFYCFSVYLVKQWQELKVFNDHTALATGVRFGQNASFLASTSMDRSLKLFGI